jgi:hypothetical protein
MLGGKWIWPSTLRLLACDEIVCAWRDVFVLTSCFLQVGDGTSMLNRLTPVDVVGLSSGVANVALGAVRLFCDA